MKAKITSAEFLKEFETKFGTLYSHKIGYNGQYAFYSSKSKEQNKFVKDKEAEFTEEKRTGKDNREYTIIKPVGINLMSNYGKAVQKEQSKYSGFAVSYVKDLIIADKIKIEDWEKASQKIFNVMVNMDKSIQS